MILVLLVAATVVRFTVLSGPVDTAAAPDASTGTVPVGSVPAVTTTLPPPPLSPEEEKARRATFIETMKRIGLNQNQANCVADKVAVTIGWSKISMGLLDPGKPVQLEQLMVDCVKA